MNDQPINIRKLDAFKGTKGYKVFRYAGPKGINRERAMVPLARSDIMLAMVQVFGRKGGEPQMHAHGGMDGFWFVLKGRAKFYGENDELLADLGEHEGVYIPRNAKYWFETGDCDQLELLQVESIDPRVENTFTTYGPEKKGGPIEVYSPEGTLIAGNVQTTE